MLRKGERCTGCLGREKKCNSNTYKACSKKFKYGARWCRDCSVGTAYHSGTMIIDNARANTAEKCLEQCNNLKECQFWDLAPEKEGGFCRLRKGKGRSGEEVAVGYISGARNCNLE